MKLAYNQLGEHGPPLIILHGVFGSGDNWKSVARSLSNEYRVYLVDQRNHGHSPHSPEMNYDAMAADLAEFMDEHQLDKAFIIGHSMGGKTAMRFSQLHPLRIIKLVVVDMGIRQYPPHHQRILEALKSIDPSKFERRSQAEEVMKKYIDEWSVRQFLLKNLYWKNSGVLDWRFNVDAINSKMENIIAALPAGKSQVPTLFIRGAHSDYISDAHWSDLLKTFPRSQLTTIEAGHWVHAEKPKELEGVFREFAAG